MRLTGMFEEPLPQTIRKLEPYELTRLNDWTKNGIDWFVVDRSDVGRAARYWPNGVWRSIRPCEDDPRYRHLDDGEVLESFDWYRYKTAKLPAWFPIDSGEMISRNWLGFEARDTDKIEFRRRICLTRPESQSFWARLNRYIERRFKAWIYDGM